MLTDYELGLVKILQDPLSSAAGRFVRHCHACSSEVLLNLPIDSRAIVYVIGALSVLLSFTTKIRAHGTGSQAAV